MENVYSLDPNPIPPGPLPSDRRHRDTVGALILTATLAIVLGILYVWNIFRTQQQIQQLSGHPTLSDQALSISRVSKAMANSSATVASAADINKMTTTLKKMPVTASTVDVQRMHRLLQNY